MAGQTLQATFTQTFNAFGQTIEFIVDKTRGPLVAIGNKIVEASKEAAGRIADQVGKFGRAITDLWAKVERFGANAAAVIKAIVNDPGRFAGNLRSGLAGGFEKFFGNIGGNLRDGLFAWLTKGLRAAGFDVPQLPETVDERQIGSFLLGFIGLSWDNILNKLTQHLGAENIALIQQAYATIGNLIALGPSGVYELLQRRLIEFDPSAMVKQAIDAGIDNALKGVIVPVIDFAANRKQQRGRDGAEQVHDLGHDFDEVGAGGSATGQQFVSSLWQ